MDLRPAPAPPSSVRPLPGPAARPDAAAGGGPDEAARALDDLRYIRAAMEGASGFTSVPGRGLTAVGGIALLAVAAVRGLDADVGSATWAAVWGAAAALALVAAAVAMQRKGGVGGARASRPGRKLLLGVGAPWAAGLLASVVAWRAGAPTSLPALWLSAYGAGVVAGGAFSPPAVVALGGSCLGLGAVAAFAPPATGDLWMGLGFGGLHLVAGRVITRRHGG